MRRTVFAASLSLALAACGNSTGVQVSAGTAAGESTESASMIERVKSLFSKKEAKATIQYPASALIIEALTEGDDMLKPNVMGMTHGFKALEHSMPTQLVEIENLDKIAMNLLTDKEVQAYIPAGPLSDAIKAGDKARVRNVVWLKAMRKPIVWASRPCQGWEVNPMGGFDFKTHTEKKPDNEAVSVYLHIFEASAAYSNDLLTDIASKLSPVVLEDPDTAKSEVRKIYYAKNPEQLQALWEKAIAATGGRVTIDMATGQDVGWTSQGGNFKCGTNGLVQIKNGVTWWGQGKLTGRDYTVGLVSSIGSSMQKSSKNTSGAGSSTGNESSGKAGTR